MSGSFTQKQIRVTFSKASGLASTGGASNTLVLEGLRCAALITKDGASTNFELSVFGMTPDQMNDLSNFGKLWPTVGQISATIEAGDASGMAVAYQGSATNAHQDFADMPNCRFT